VDGAIWDRPGQRSRNDSSLPRSLQLATAVVNLSGRPLRPRARWVAAVTTDRGTRLPVWLLAAEVLTPSLAFYVGSFKYQIHKECADLRDVAGHPRTHCAGLGNPSGIPDKIPRAAGALGAGELIVLPRAWTILIHADTIVLIMGLPTFLCPDRPDALLEGLTFSYCGATRAANFFSFCRRSYVNAIRGGLHRPFRRRFHDGPDHRTLVISSCFSGRRQTAIRIRGSSCTPTLTTICGGWVAYGEPTNLIMKANTLSLLGKHILCYLLRSGSSRQATFNRPTTRKDCAISMCYLDMRWNVVEAECEGCAAYCKPTRRARVLTPIEFTRITRWNRREARRGRP